MLSTKRADAFPFRRDPAARPPRDGEAVPGRRSVRQLERPLSLTAMAVEALRQAIVSGDLGIGEQLSEGVLARMLGISKTPVREALQQLRSEGLVRIVPQTGTFVFTMSAREVVELCELRLTLEQAALALALKRNRGPFLATLKEVVAEMEETQARGDVRAYLALDTRYHNAFFAHCDNSYMAEAYARIVGKVAALRTHLAVRPSHTEKSMIEHRALVKAIEAGRDRALAAILSRHIERTKRSYTRNIDDIAKADSVFDARRPKRSRLPPLR
ncbi:MAG: GntR family transcriptional regulator [Rhodospirillaceae bacterium]|nr:GntR family transcriptional regulator [Rhodospirillaceae bacterium]